MDAFGKRNGAKAQLIRKKKLLKKHAQEIDENDLCLPFIFDLPCDRLEFIDSKDQLTHLKKFLTDAKLLGIDTETKPDMKGRSKHPVALLQIAARLSSGYEKVYVLDLLKFLPKCTQELDEALGDVFASSEIIKIGQGLEQDAQELHESYPQSKCFQILRGCIETNALHRVLRPRQHLDLGLKAFCRQYLHCNLVKTQQCSDWSQRPLSESQLHYSACDALVLLRLYDAMLMEIGYQVENFDVTSHAVDFEGASKSRQCQHCGQRFTSLHFMEHHQLNCQQPGIGCRQGYKNEKKVILPTKRKKEDCNLILSPDVSPKKEIKHFHGVLHIYDSLQMRSLNCCKGSPPLKKPNTGKIARRRVHQSVEVNG